MKKFEIYRAERKKGLTYQQIADRYGVSRQVVAQACGRYNTYNFRFWNSSSCIYPNVRKWLNENKITYAELSRRMGNGYTRHYTLRAYLRGICYPPKLTIDKFLSVTNLTYEQFFETDRPTEKGDAE